MNLTLALRFDPYAYVRTAVMRSSLYAKADYDKLMKMGFSEIAKFMQDSKYHAQINELAMDFSGADLLEHALYRNFVEDCRKLRRICNADLREVVDAYLLRKDVWNLKTILRARYAHVAEGEIKHMLVPVGSISQEHLYALLKKEDIPALLASLPIIDEALRTRLIESYSVRKDLLEVENALDRFVFASLLNFAGRLPHEGAALREFFLTEIDVQNLLTILRLKRSGSDTKTIQGYLVGEGLRINGALLRRLAHARSFDDAIKALSGTPFAALVNNVPKEGSMVAIETTLMHYLCKKSVSFVHKGMLSPNVIIGYLFLKDMEVRNLQIIIRGKQLGMEDGFIEAQLAYQR